jgi:hypothetical protein
LYGSVGDWGVDLSDCFNGLVTGGVYFLGSEMSIVGPATRHLVAVFLSFGRLLIAPVLDFANDVGGQILDIGTFGGCFQYREDEFVVVFSTEFSGHPLTDSVFAQPL